MALTYEQIQAAAKKKGISQANVDKFAAMKGVTTTPTAYKSIDKTAIVPNAGVSIDPTTGSTYQAGYARKKPMVATPQDSVKNFTVGELTYDAANPEDYLMRLQAKAQTNPAKVTETERYQGMVAQKALNELQKSKASVNPFTDTTKLQEDLLREQSIETQRDATALDEYKKALQAQYDTGKQELLASGERERDAAQTVLSFSGFGRSSDAVRTATEIQQKTDSAINNLNAAMQAEIALKQAELEGADGDTLSSIREQINSYNKAAQDWQIEAIKNTAAANATNGTNYMDAINNLVATTAAAGIELGSAKDIKEWASLARNADGTINEEFIKTVPADLQAIIRSAAQTSMGGTGEAAKTQSVGSGKYEKVYQRNPETNRYDIPVGGSGFGSGGGGGGGSGSTNIPLGDLNSDILSNLYSVGKAIAGSTIRSSGIIDPSIRFKLDFIKSNLTLEKIAELKKRGVSLGALSEGEWTALANTIGNLNAGVDKVTALEQINRMIRNAGGIPLTKDQFKAGENPVPATTPGTSTQTPLLPSGGRL